MDAVALPAPAAHVHDVLNAIEQFLRDNRFMPTGAEFAVDFDPSRVVGVLEHPMQQFERDRALRDGATCTCGQSEVGHRCFELFEAVVAGRIEFKCLVYQGSTLWIEGDGVDLFAFVFDPDVQVANFGEANRAAVAGLGAHLLLNV
nr:MULTISPECIES: hypothetical protein [Nocardia]